MSNKKIFKKIYFEKINKEKNYKVILDCIEKNNIKKTKWVWVIIPICLIFVGITLFNKDKIDIHNNDIFINYFEKLSSVSTDIDVKFEEKSIEEFKSKFNFIKKLNIQYESISFGEMYVRNDLDDSNYSKLYGHSLMYIIDESKPKTIDIFFSKTEKERLSCLIYNIDLNNLKNSNINNTTVKIIKVGNWYIGMFQYNNWYFDIETYNLTEQEFIKVVESITK